jgi:fused signal recognition particle receptor
MSEEGKKGLGFFKRLFGRKQKSQTETTPDIAETPVAKPALPQKKPKKKPAKVKALAKPKTAVQPKTVSKPKPKSEKPGEKATVEARQHVPEETPKKQRWFSRLKDGLTRSSTALTDNITSIFTKRRLDAETLLELEDILIQADLGIDTALRITDAIAKDRYDKEVSPEEVRAFLAAEVEAVLQPVALPLVIDDQQTPFVILVVGVNGTGKTTTIGKLASNFKTQGKSVMLAAGDTFRAAAIDQLKIWGKRADVPVISSDVGADAAGLAFDALHKARDTQSDILIIDTAGRLQNKADLMAELEKIIRVLKKQDATAPHAVLLVLDATTGQNALNQVEIFQKMAGVTGLIVTKLDGTARGGILVAIADKYGLPVHAIGIGEGIDDMQPFNATDFAIAIAGQADDQEQAA